MLVRGLHRHSLAVVPTYAGECRFVRVATVLIMPRGGTCVGFVLDPERPARGAPLHLQRTVCPARLGEQHQREEVCALAELQPGPAPVLLRARVAAVQRMVSRFDVVAEVLVARTERVDVVA